MQSAVQKFFSSPSFAVAGASQDRAKFGYKVLAWYHAHSLPVVPLNPRTPSITLTPSGTTYPCITSPSHLPNPTTTSLSIITPPPITLQLLHEAKSVGIPAVFLQPGTFDDKVVEYCKKEFEGSWVAGLDDGGGESNGGEGWCVLVDGEWGLEKAGRGWERRKL